MSDIFDVIIIGAGLSGVGAACHLQRELPGKRVLLLEGRGAMGGTWDLFRYPGIRSDSDMFTLGYSFEPWNDHKALADGPSIKAYIERTARKYGVDEKIRFHHKVKAVSWSSDEALWTVEAEHEGKPVTFKTRFLWGCSGYYRYDRGYAPEFPGRERFKGTFIHPQFWPEDLDYTGKRVVVIGSGATAVTLVPSMADRAAHVVMLQRTPTYIASLPAVDRLAELLRDRLPPQAAYDVVRWKNILRAVFFYEFMRRAPQLSRSEILRMVREAIGPSVDVDKHFSPPYNPWDQRLCFVPDGDLFKALREGRASVVTDHIETFTETGLQLRSGQTLDADIVISATGLELLFFGNIQMTVDGRVVVPNELFNYKGCMFSGVPNMAVTFGYTNASWTLKADLIARLVCRIIERMDDRGARSCTPMLDASVKGQPFADLASGYFQRALDRLPRQGDRYPWRVYQNYLLDSVLLRPNSVDDRALVMR